MMRSPLEPNETRIRTREVLVGMEFRKMADTCFFTRHVSTASIRQGPRPPSARLNASASSLSVPALKAGSPKPFAKLSPFDYRSGEFGEGLRLGTGLSDTGAGKFGLQNAVAAIRADNHGYVRALAGHRPERLEGVQAAAVGLEGDHAPLRAGESGAERIGQALADGAARDEEHGVGRGFGRIFGVPGEARRDRFVHDNGILRSERRQRPTQDIGGEGAAGGHEDGRVPGRADHVRRLQFLRQSFQREGGIEAGVRVGEGVQGRALGSEARGLPRLGEEGDRIARPREHQAGDVGKSLDGLLREIGQGGEKGEVATALLAGGKGFDPDLAGRGGRYPRGGTQTPRGKRAAAKEDSGAAPAQQERCLTRRRTRRFAQGGRRLLGERCRPRSHWQSAGRIRDATRPGGPSAASTAARLASAISSAEPTVRIQPTVAARAAISEVRGASNSRCRRG